MAGPGAYVFGDEERREVEDVLRGGHLSRYGSGDDPGFTQKVHSLEREFAAHCGVAHAVATSSGTGALLISLLAAGIGPGDEVLVPGFTYVATMGAVVHARAVPVLVEVDESLTMDPEDLRRKITPRTRAVLVVHMLGNPCDMRSILKIVEDHDLVLIEDACQAGGGSYEGRALGSFGALGAFSFNRYKMMTAGDGGIVVTDDQGLYERAFALHDQGHIPLRSGGKMAGHARSLIGLNFKMNELTGAVALAQLRKVDQIVATLREKKATLRGRIPDLPGVRARVLNDPAGDCGSLLTYLFDDRSHAEAVAERLGVRTVAASGWHVYGLMDQIVEHKTPVPGWSEPARYAQPGDLPRTDDILGRAVNISVGVVDTGIGAGFGININSSDAEITSVAERFTAACTAAA
ncbi:DegT/DnrJ/EryC1/StrS family aminotransferase [Actinomadura syzygii]|uniref:DegT/DnrJ/EryC1/StrS family aminotransferase n=1 Tax=Actinomadura syzygii TaxID=1427538 RepID=A0A5D0TQ40_9ACTN|nr:DegT/DnrJ/EryC1/StrS family aminotransferase [Actinomadura syzygii]TYC07392.1 DegT/DnrJ/EryC1/StrS family aminotransferase [Actinomadura syzygii]